MGYHRASRRPPRPVRIVLCCETCGAQIVDPRKSGDHVFVVGVWTHACVICCEPEPVVSPVCSPDPSPRKYHECPLCSGWCRQWTPWPTVAVASGAPEIRFPEWRWWRHRGARGMQVGLVQHQSRYRNGQHLWPDQRREKRETKRLGGKLRRRALDRAWRLDLADESQ